MGGGRLKRGLQRSVDVEVVLLDIEVAPWDGPLAQAQQHTAAFAMCEGRSLALPYLRLP